MASLLKKKSFSTDDVKFFEILTVHRRTFPTNDTLRNLAVYKDLIRANVLVNLEEIRKKSSPQEIYTLVMTVPGFDPKEAVRTIKPSEKCDNPYHLILAVLTTPLPDNYRSQALLKISDLTLESEKALISRQSPKELSRERSEIQSERRNLDEMMSKLMESENPDLRKKGRDVKQSLLMLDGLSTLTTADSPPVADHVTSIQRSMVDIRRLLGNPMRQQTPLIDQTTDQLANLAIGNLVMRSFS